MKIALICLLALCHNATGFVALCSLPSPKSLLPSLLVPQHRYAISTRQSRTCKINMSFWEGIQQQLTTARLAVAPRTKGDSKCPVLICPAQLSIPEDYRNMMNELNDRGFPAYCADLTRLGWITGLLPSAFSLEYISGELVPSKTLKFYYEAIARALEELKANHPGEGVHLVGHSIGGWVSRAWLAEECSDADREITLSLTTLGTPNNNPPTVNSARRDWTALDQTRGLLKNINERFPGAHVDGVQYTSVCGTALQGKFPGNIEEMLASLSYSPLGGDGEACGDGIIPFSIAALEGSNIVELPTSKHSGFIPFPGEAIDLGEEFLWYGSPSLIDEWVGNLDEAERKAKVSRKLGGGLKATGTRGGLW